MNDQADDIQSSETDRKWTKYPSRLWGSIATSWRSYRSWESEQYAWKISDFGALTISRESSGSYVASITTTLTYTNSDGRCPLDIFPTHSMYISHIGSGRQGDYYTLSTQDLGLQRVAPEGSLDVKHTFSMRTGAPPLLSGTAQCTIRGNVIGEMNLPEGLIKGTLTLKGSNTFDTKVTKEWIRE
ncbi:MAG: hypothetical protein JSU58_04430 [Dehalococcoidales bacterium]|nr:MAG: hypothetical protein JSU58_04430 [Dehalococcoidales bacterium]